MTGDKTDNEKKDKQPGMGKTFSLVAILTVASKLVGLARDIVVNQAYGTGIVADAYQYAYMFTGNILILFGGLGGPFHSSVVAILTPRKDDPAAGKLLTQIFLLTLMGLLLATLLVCLAAPLVINFWLPTYTIHPEHLPAALQTWSANSLRGLLEQQILDQLFVMSPLIVISGLVGISYGISNVYNRVFWPSLSPAVASIAIIAAVYAYADPRTALTSGLPLAFGTLAGAVAQFLLQTPDLLQTKMEFSMSTKDEPGLKEYGAMIFPAIFSTSIGQLTVYVDSMFAGHVGQGAWAVIINSNRLVQLPLGVLLTAMLVPILPRFTQQVEAQQIDELKEEFRRAFRFLCFLAFPLAALLIAIPEPIVRLLFERGQFNADSTHDVSIALLFLAPSILFYVGRDLITRVFYAFKDSSTPFRVALIALAVKAALDYFFVYVLEMDVRGISIASTIITILNLMLLSYFLKGKIGPLGFTRMIQPLTIMLLASAACGAAAFGVEKAIDIGETLKLPLKLHANNPHWPLLVFSSISFCIKAIPVAVACLAAGLVYFISCIIFRLEELDMLAKRVPILGKLLKR